MSTITKMNGRDRNLLILIVTAIVFYLCYNFVMAPFKMSTEMLAGELEAAESELARVKALSGKEDELKEQEVRLKEEIAGKYSAFLTDIKQSRILYRMDSYATATGFPITDYMPSSDIVTQVTVATGLYVPQDFPLKNLALKINADAAGGEAGDRNQRTVPSQPSPAAGGAGEEGSVPAAVESEDMIPGTDVAIGFDAASYESIYNFIGQVERMNKTAFLRSVEIKESQGSLGGKLTFSFYSLPPFDPNMKDGLDFKPAIPMGKANPFN